MNNNALRIGAIVLVLIVLVVTRDKWFHRGENVQFSKAQGQHSSSVSGGKIQKPATSIQNNAPSAPATSAAPDITTAAAEPSTSAPAADAAPKTDIGVAKATSKSATTIPFRVEPLPDGGTRYAFPVNRGYDERIAAMKKKWGAGKPSTDTSGQDWITFDLTRAQAAREKMAAGK